MKILENAIVLDAMQSVRSEFGRVARDLDQLERYYTSLGEIDFWRYSTGPLFDDPPYASEMDGIDGGRCLENKYSCMYEARLQETFSSGFSGGMHVLTIAPSEVATSPLVATFFESRGTDKIVTNIDFYDHEQCRSAKPPSLIGLGRLFSLDECTRAYVNVGSGAAYSVTLYHFDSEGRINSASMVTAPFAFQSDYQMHYAADGMLESITSGDVIWQRGDNGHARTPL